MANAVDQNPLILDTGAATVIVTSTFKITKIIWDNPGGDVVASDKVVLKDKNGKIFYERTIHDVGTGADAFVELPESDFCPPFVANGLIATTISHGKVYVYFTDQASPLKTS